MSRISKSGSRTISRAEIGNFLENFKIYILGSLSEHVYTLKILNKKKFENVALYILCPRCRKKHALRECPIYSIEICVICVENHNRKGFPLIPGLKAVFQDEVVTSQDESLCFIAKILWKNQ